MKQKLLITMGCSLTEGVGCYDMEHAPFPDISYKDKEYFDFYNFSKPRFHQLGWPNRLGQKLGYDKVLNLGKAGSSPSGNVKNFIDRYQNYDFSKWEVLLIWMVPSPTRISFYTSEILHDYIPTLKDKNTEIGAEYLKLLQDVDIDSSMEAIFYIKLMIELCKNRNFNFLYFNLDYDTDKLWRKIYDSPHHLYQNHGDYAPWIYENNNVSKFTSSVCHHPNEVGYENIAKKTFDRIKIKFPKFINKITPSNFEWEWDGHYDGYYYRDYKNYNNSLL